MQAFGHHAMHVATAGQGSIRDDAHQTVCRSAIDYRDARVSQCPAKRSGAIGERLRCAVVRSAKYGDGLD
jgi:hypothetical protein